MKKLTSCVLAVIFLLSTPYISIAYEKEINNLSASMAKKIADSGKKTIAVVDFTNLQGNVSELGRFIAEEFSTALVDTGKGFEIVDRIHLKSILKEHKLSMSGLIDPATARKLGKIAGVDAILTGTITPFGDEVRLSVKVLATDTAKIICASRGNIPKTKAIGDLINRGIVGPPGDEGTPINLGADKEVQVEDFKFIPVKCKRSRDKMICTVSVINNGSKERVLEVNSRAIPYSYLYDNFGNEYSVCVQIGRKMAELTPGSSRNIEQRFLPQIRTNVNFIAEEVNSDATHITVAIGINDFKKIVIVKNIPISK